MVDKVGKQEREREKLFSCNPTIKKRLFLFILKENKKETSSFFHCLTKFLQYNLKKIIISLYQENMIY